MPGNVEEEEAPLPEEIGSADDPSLPFTRIDWDNRESGDADGKVGADVIQTLVKRLPNSPGVHSLSFIISAKTDKCTQITLPSVESALTASRKKRRCDRDKSNVSSGSLPYARPIAAKTSRA